MTSSDREVLGSILELVIRSCSFVPISRYLGHNKNTFTQMSLVQPETHIIEVAKEIALYTFSSILVGRSVQRLYISVTTQSQFHVEFFLTITRLTWELIRIRLGNL